MFLFISLLFVVAQSTKFVSYIGKAGPGWANPGTNADFLKYIGVPGYGGDLGYNVLNFAFWVSNSNNGGAAVDGAAYDWQNILNRITDASLRTTLTGTASPTAADLRAGIKQLYAAGGIDICISAFGGADHPMGNGADAADTALALAQYGKDYDYDCYDIDWEEAYYGYFGDTAYGEEWLCELTNTLYSNLASGQYLTHAPQAPYFMGAPQYPLGGYTTVHKNCGHQISWYNVQFYNQGSTKYDSYDTLFVNADGWSSNSAVYEIMDGASSENVPVPAEKIVVGKHTLGDGSTFVSGSTLKSIFNEALAAGRWSTGFMSWQLYTEIASTDKLIDEVSAANWIPSVPTPPTTARPTTAPVPIPTNPVTGNVEIVNFGDSTIWYYACNVQGEKYAVSSVEVLMSNGAWFGCEEETYAWKCGVTSSISYPLSVRVGGVNGETLTGYNVVTSPDDKLVFDLGSNFGSTEGGGDDGDNDTDTGTDNGGDGDGDDDDDDSNPPAPAPLPTPPPIPDSGSSGSGITITSRAGSGAWWYTCALSGVPAGITIESVKMQSSGGLSWETGVYQTWSGGYYSFSKNTPYSPPLSFKIKSTTGQELTAMDLVPSLTAGSSGTMTKTFSSAFVYEDTSGNGESDGTLWFALIMVVLVLIGAAVLFVMRRRRGQTKVYFDDSKGIEATELATNDMMQSGTANPVASMDEIVVEVEAHQPMTTAGYQ